MNLRWAAISLALVLGIAGGFIVYLAKTQQTQVAGLDLTQPRHPVTAELTKQAEAMAKTVAPFFRVQSTEGKPVLVGGKGPKPQFIYFVKEGCPCSIDGEPLMQNLAKQFGGRIEFVSVTDAKIDSAKKWEYEMRVPYPLISNPKLDMMKAYHAKGSLMSALVGTDGVIIKYWPGYSKDILKEMNSIMAKTLNEPAKPFDTQYAPVRKTTGCEFGS